VETTEEAVKFVDEIKKKCWDARHNCMAYIIGGEKRFSDDGEPSGTAGKPMLEVLEGRNMDNVVVVVTRYFGGILLGTGGLVRAYQGAVTDALNNSVIGEMRSGVRCEMVTDYQSYGKIEYAAGNIGVKIEEKDFSDVVRLVILSDDELYGKFIKTVTEATAGKIDILSEKKTEYCSIEK